jgi:hypothetical protein
MKAVATSMGIPVLLRGAMPTPTFFMPSAGTLAVAGCSGVQLGYLLVVCGRESVGWKAYMMPGAIALTLMPLGACCFARARVKVTMAPLVEE